MVRRMKSSLLLAVLMGSYASVHALTIPGITTPEVTFSGFQVPGFQIPKFTTPSLEIPRAIAGTVLLTGTLAAGTALFAIYIQYKQNRALKYSSIFDDAARTLDNVEKSLDECIKLADRTIIPTCSTFNIPTEILNDKATWEYYIRKMQPRVDQLMYLTAPENKSFWWYDLKDKITANIERARLTLAEYQRLNKVLETTAPKTVAVGLWNYRCYAEAYRRALAYYQTIIPSYIQKAAFVRQLIETHRNQFEEAQRQAYEQVEAHRTCVACSCDECSCKTCNTYYNNYAQAA